MPSQTETLWLTLLKPGTVMQACVRRALQEIAAGPVPGLASAHYAQCALNDLDSARSYQGRRNCRVLFGWAKDDAIRSIRNVVVELELENRRYR